MKPCLFALRWRQRLAANPARADTTITTFDNFISDTLYPSWPCPRPRLFPAPPVTASPPPVSAAITSTSKILPGKGRATHFSN